jgi:hypothetical protein
MNGISQLPKTVSQSIRGGLDSFWLTPLKSEFVAIDRTSKLVYGELLKGLEGLNLPAC